MPAHRLGRCFPCEVAVAHGTFSRHFRWWRKQIRTLCVTPAHWISLVLWALALCSILDHLRTPLVLNRKTPRSPWGWCFRVNQTCRAPNRTLVSTRCTGTCNCRTLYTYRWGRTRLTRRPCVCPVWCETVNTKEICNYRRDIQVGTVRL